MAGPAGFQKGHPCYKLPGTKNKETIAKEERRAIFDAEASKIFLQKIAEAKPEYILDQFLGKAGDKLDITTQGDKVGTLLPEIIAKAEEILKQQKMEDDK
jgi:hypothetical protein